MNIPSLSFNDHVGIENCADPKSGIFQLPEDPKYLNHLQSVHASAIFALGEASSGAFLLEQTKHLAVDEYIPLLRRADIKYRMPGEGRLYGIGKYVEEDWTQFLEGLQKNGRSIIRLPIQIMTDSGKYVAEANYEWFVFKKPEEKSTD
jgi:acyl-coenzyme A thioesterase PaaI-like protein